MKKKSFSIHFFRLFCLLLAGTGIIFLYLFFFPLSEDKNPHIVIRFIFFLVATFLFIINASKGKKDGERGRIL